MTTKQFGKPQAAAQKDGVFKFKLPDDLGSGRGRIPKGKYIGRCTGVVFEHAKSSGNPMWTWTFVTTKGPTAGRDWKLWTALTDDAAWKVVETLKALGLDAEPGEEVKVNRKEVVGVGVTLHIKDDNGQDGDGEFSKLDKISAHPNGAGYKPGSLASKKDEDDDRDYPAEMDEGAAEDDDDETPGQETEEEETPAEEEEEKPKRKTTPPPAKRGKVPVRRR